MATVKGVWVFNENPAAHSSGFNVLVSFTSNGSSATRLVTGTSGVIQYMFGGYDTVYDGSTWFNEAYRTVDFGETEQTVSDSVYTWLTANAVQQGSEPETDTIYTVNGSSLTTVANAIRGKTGTTGELIFPDGYVSAIEDISSVSDLSNAKDIAFGGNESGGKYVIEDETITPLFDQIQRVTKTEAALTFEEATVSLLNIVPGGGLPSAEESSFGKESDIEYGISFDASNASGYQYSGYYTAYTEYEAKEAFSLLGVRAYMAGPSGNSLSINVSINGVTKGNFYLAKSSVKADDWNVFYFEQPFNVAVGDKIKIWQDNMTYPDRVSTSKVTFNGKIKWTDGTYSGYVWGIFDVIIGAVETDIPDEYSVTRTTMDDIAEEVQRISGTTAKMTTSQILTTLQSIQLQDKSITPTAEVQTITPNDGYYGLSSVTVGAITEENEAVIEIINEKMEVVANDTY